MTTHKIKLKIDTEEIEIEYGNSSSCYLKIKKILSEKKIYNFNLSSLNCQDIDAISHDFTKETEISIMPNHLYKLNPENLVPKESFLSYLGYFPTMSPEALVFTQTRKEIIKKIVNNVYKVLFLIGPKGVGKSMTCLKEVSTYHKNSCCYVNLKTLHEKEDPVMFALQHYIKAFENENLDLFYTKNNLLIKRLDDLCSKIQECFNNGEDIIAKKFPILLFIDQFNNDNPLHSSIYKSLTSLCKNSSFESKIIFGISNKNTPHVTSLMQTYISDNSPKFDGFMYDIVVVNETFSEIELDETVLSVFDEEEKKLIKESFGNNIGEIQNFIASRDTIQNYRKDYFTRNKYSDKVKLFVNNLFEQGQASFARTLESIGKTINIDQVHNYKIDYNFMKIIKKENSGFQIEFSYPLIGEIYCHAIFSNDFKKLINALLSNNVLNESLRYILEENFIRLCKNSKSMSFCDSDSNSSLKDLNFSRYKEVTNYDDVKLFKEVKNAKNGFIVLKTLDTSETGIDLIILIKKDSSYSFLFFQITTQKADLQKKASGLIARSIDLIPEFLNYFNIIDFNFFLLSNHLEILNDFRLKRKENKEVGLIHFDLAENSISIIENPEFSLNLANIHINNVTTKYLNSYDSKCDDFKTNLNSLLTNTEELKSKNIAINLPDEKLFPILNFSVSDVYI